MELPRLASILVGASVSRMGCDGPSRRNDETTRYTECCGRVGRTTQENCGTCTNSVLGWLDWEDETNRRRMQWRNGPPMNQPDSPVSCRRIVCHGQVYVRGGYRDRSRLDCSERIAVQHLLLLLLQNKEQEQDVSCATSAPETNPWSRLKCRLSSKRSGCCAVAVHDRFIVVMGGDKNKKEHLSSSINGYHGYSCAHCDCGTSHDCCSVWCHQCSLWALQFCGGRAPPNRGTHESVECFEFGTVWDHPTINDDDTSAARQVFPPSPCVVLGPFRRVWSVPSISWSVVAVGFCWIVAVGGMDMFEVHAVWIQCRAFFGKLPEFITWPRTVCTLYPGCGWFTPRESLP